MPPGAIAMPEAPPFMPPQPWHIAQPAGDNRAQVGSLRQPAAPVLARRGQIGGTQQGGDRPGGVTAMPDPVRGLSSRPATPLIRPGCRLGEMPCAALRLAGEMPRQRLMSVAALRAGGQRYHRCTGQRMTERGPHPRRRGPARPLGCGQIIHPMRPWRGRL